MACATATNAYDLLPSKTELEIALAELAEIFEQTYFNHQAKEQRAGEIGTSRNYLEYLGPPEIAEMFSSNQPDTCSIADVD